MADVPTLAAGDPAPAFDLPATGAADGRVSLAGLRGRKVVLYFYPRDDTPGCTKEGIAFTGAAGAFDAAGATIVGISKDDMASHGKFAAKHDLAVILASDADAATCEDYGVWGEKSMYGKTFMGIERATFLIDADGGVARVWRNVKVPGHVEEVLAAVAD